MQLLWLRIPLLLGISFLRPPGPRIRSTSESHQINWLKNCREKNKSLVMTEPPCQQQFTVSVTMIFDLPNSFIFSISIFIMFKTTVVFWFLCLTYIRRTCFGTPLWIFNLLPNCARRTPSMSCQFALKQFLNVQTTTICVLPNRTRTVTWLFGRERMLRTTINWWQMGDIVIRCIRTISYKHKNNHTAFI